MVAVASKYTGKAQGFELVAVPQKAEDYTVEMFGGPVVVPAGDGILLSLRREKQMTGAIHPPGSPRSHRDIARRLVYSLNQGIHGPVRPAADMTDEAWAAFNAAVTEATERVQAWTLAVAPLIADALAVLVED